MEFQCIGKSVLRTDAYDKVTGRAQFTADIKLPGMLYAKILRGEHGHAKIISIDTSEAEAMPGVRKIVTGQGCTMLFGACIKDQPPLATDKVRHAGEGVAAVIAETEKEAEEAMKKIKVVYEPLPHVTDPLESVAEGAPIIHERNHEYARVPGFPPVKGTNIFHHYKLRKGDTEKGFKESEVTVEEDFYYPLISHVQMEPHACISWWDSPTSVHIWASTQAPFLVREIVSQMFHIPMANIKVEAPYLGGGFGGKSDVVIEPMCAYISSFVPGHPVKLVLTRKEAFTSSLVGRGMRGKIKIGAKKDGKLVALEASLHYADGAYGDTGCNVVTASGFVATGPYEYEHCKIDCYGVYTNSPPVGAYRGYGHPEAHLMTERAMNILAEKLGMTHQELMRKNFLCDGKENALGQIIRPGNGNLYKCLEEVENALYEKPFPKEDENFLYGRGIASFMKTPMMTPNASSGAILRMCEDGSFNISISGIEMGQGCQTVLSQIAAETLKVPLEKINISKYVDTQYSPYEWQTVGSITTYRAGNAVIQACNRAIEKMLQSVSLLHHRPVEDLKYEGEFITSKSDLNLKVECKKLAQSYLAPDGHGVGEQIVTTGSHLIRNVQFPGPETGRGNCAGSWTYACEGAEVKVNKKTGDIDVTHLAIAIDLGKALNPELARIQMLGGMMMGYGATFTEELLFDDKGRIKNANLNQYKIPKLSHVPEKFTVKFVETPDEGGPYGARCIAEHPIIGIPPAVLNAIKDATGVDLFEIPVKPKVLLEKMGGVE
ncbi:MAG: xanthine dehydrogenase family protein molybdopterin-binding subunit [Candidatus Eremiobacterota bacterium]